LTSTNLAETQLLPT